jgi:hypothetical protein
MDTHFLSEGDDSRRGSLTRYVKVGAALGVVSLVLLYFVALPVQSQGQTTNLIALRASRPWLSAQKSSAFNVPSLSSIPGPSPWKELALAGIESSNRCDGDVSPNANRVTKVYASLDDKNKAEVAKVAQSAWKLVGSQELVKTATELKAGQTAPLGFFDPLGFSTDVSPGKLLFFREAEIKHGRVCMFASVGYLYGELFHPFYGEYRGQAYKLVKGGVGQTDLNTFWVVLFCVLAVPELMQIFPGGKYNYYNGFGTLKESDRIPGDWGFDPLNLKENLDFEEMQNKELNNGRLAMMAWAGQIGQELATGKTLSGGGWLGKIDQFLDPAR